MQLRDTLTTCFIGLAAVGAVALVSTGDPALPDHALVLGLLPAVAVAHLAGRRGFSRLAAAGHYEPVLTGVLLVAVLAGLIGAVV